MRHLRLRVADPSSEAFCLTPKRNLDERGSIGELATHFETIEQRHRGFPSLSPRRTYTMKEKKYNNK